MTIVICDIDDSSSRVLEDIVTDILAERNVGGYTIEKCEGQNGLEKYTDIAVLFIEINLGKENGMEIAKELRRQEEKMPIVFVSSSKEYAVESYDVDAFGYLMKPVQPEKVRRIMDKLLKQNEEYIVRDTRGNEKLKVPLQNIEYFESKNTSILLHLANGLQIRTYGKLGNIEKELKNKNFLRCHQSYLINMDHIVGIREACFIMNSGEAAYIRKRDYTVMKNKFYQYIVNK